MTFKEGIFDSFRPEKIDVKGYRATLIKYRSLVLTGDRVNYIQDVRRRIRNLHIAIHYTSSLEKTKMQVLLCEYLTFLATAAGEQNHFDKAITLLTDAIVVAKENDLYDSYAYALRERGRVYADRGELASGLTNFPAAQADFELAMADFDASKKLKTKLSPLRYGIVIEASARIYAYNARDSRELTVGLSLLDEAMSLIGRDGDDLTLQTKFNEERIHLTRGAALILSPVSTLRNPAKARQEFDQAAKLTKPDFKLRHIENDVRQAQAYYLEGQFPRFKLLYPDEPFAMALSHAESALELLRETPCTYLSDLENLYWGLSESSYGKNENVARFGVELLKLQHPTLFART